MLNSNGSQTAVKDEFDWLYETEHYEPAVGLYEPTNTDVACRLKNPPPDASQDSLLSVVDRSWELLDRAEVEHRMGTRALNQRPLPDNVERFVSIPATIHYTIWSDLYICGGVITIEEPTGRVSKSTGLPSVKKVRGSRGCGLVFSLWDVAFNSTTGEVQQRFACPRCQQMWVKTQLKRSGLVPVVTNYSYRGLKLRKKGKSTVVGDAGYRTERPVNSFEKNRIAECGRIIGDFSLLRSFQMWTDGPQYRRNALRGRNIRNRCRLLY